MENLVNYVKPELLILSFVLFFIGKGLKKSKTVKDKYIPIVLGLIGVLLSAVWVVANTPITNTQEVAMAVFTAVVQGILVAGLSNYMNEIVKQKNKIE